MEPRVRNLPPPQFSDFRLLLQHELTTRTSRNPKYSLRSFAKALGIGSSELSRIINSKRPLTIKLIDRIGQRLHLAPEVITHYRQELLHRKTAERTLTNGSLATPNYQQVSVDVFHAISEWYHFAMIELMKTTGYRQDARWIASRLGITPSEVNIARERLVRLGFLGLDSTGQYHVEAGDTTVLNEFNTDSARQRLQKSLLQKAMAAVDEVPFARRDQSTITMAIDTRKLGEARAMIKGFRRQLNEFLEKGESCDDVYVLNVSLFPVTEEDNKKANSNTAGSTAPIFTLGETHQ